MSKRGTDAVTIEQRQAIFLAVVEEQDGGKAVAESRSVVAQRFSVTEEQVKAIEREGLAANWPPLAAS